MAGGGLWVPRHDAWQGSPKPAPSHGGVARKWPDPLLPFMALLKVTSSIYFSILHKKLVNMQETKLLNVILVKHITKSF